MRQPPHVESPSFWQLWQWTFTPLAFLDRCAQKYGDSFVVTLSSAKPSWLFVSHPQSVADIFSQSDRFDVGRIQEFLRPSMGTTSSPLLDGEPHRRRRQLLMPPFHGEKLRACGSLMMQVTEEVIHAWDLSQPFSIMPSLSEITLRVMLKSVFGLHDSEQSEKLKGMLRQFLALALAPPAYALAFYPVLSVDRGWWKPNAPYQLLRQRVDELLYEQIRYQRQHLNPDRPDILTLLLLTQDENGDSLSDEEIRDELMTQLIAGHDSSSATIAWALYLIHTHPAVRTRLLAELDSLELEADPTAIARLPYLSAVCSEALRLRSAGPAGFGRIANEPVQVGDYTLEPETIVFMSQYLTHHRSDIYPEPRQFKPERFIDRQYAASEFYPFGGGDRYCIGAAFALYEMKLVLAKVLTCYELTLAQPVPIQAVRRGINIAPQGGVKMMVRPRVRVPALAVI
jgi:cytochrome P450 family 110